MARLVHESSVTFPTRAGTWELSDDLLRDIQDVYKHIDVIEELSKAKLWLDANPGRRKTEVGMKRFITNWLNAATRQAKTIRRDGAYVEPKGARPGTDPEYLRVYQEHYFRLEKELGNLEASREAVRLANKEFGR